MQRAATYAKHAKLNRSHLRKLCEAGWTDAHIADFFGISPSTLTKWKARWPDFAKMMKDWKDEADKRVERSCFESAMGYDVIEEKIFVHMVKVKETKPDGTVLEYENPKIIRVPTHKHIPKNITAQIFWMTNRMSGDWKRTRQDAASDPLTVKVLNLIKNGNGNGNGNGHRKLAESVEGEVVEESQAITVESSVNIERGGLQIVE